MWHLGDKVRPDRKLRAIVRSKVAGVTKEGVLVSPSVKLEHQPQFGAEQVSASQCCKEWISALIRPGSVPTRVRVTLTVKYAWWSRRVSSSSHRKAGGWGPIP